MQILLTDVSQAYQTYRYKNFHDHKKKLNLDVVKVSVIDQLFAKFANGGALVLSICR